MAKQVGPALSKPAIPTGLRGRRSDWEGVRRFHQGQECENSINRPDTWQHPIHYLSDQVIIFSLHQRAGPYMGILTFILKLKHHFHTRVQSFEYFNSGLTTFRLPEFVCAGFLASDLSEIISFLC